jgi:hypothetical protein
MPLKVAGTGRAEGGQDFMCGVVVVRMREVEGRCRREAGSEAPDSEARAPSGGGWVEGDLDWGGWWGI